MAIRVRPARRAVVLRARRLLKDLDRPLFHRWGRLMLWYAQARRSANWLRRATTWGLGCLLALASPHGRHEAPDGQGEHLQRAVEKLDEHLFEATILLRVTGPQDRSQDAPHRLHAMLAALGTFHNTEFAAFKPGRMRRSAGNCRHGSPFLLSAAELATLWQA